MTFYLSHLTIFGMGAVLWHALFINSEHAVGVVIFGGFTLVARAVETARKA